MRLSTNIVGTWLQTQLIANSPHKILVAYARQPDMPDRCLTIMRAGTGRDQYDGMFEEVPFRCQSRGRSESIDDAEQLAFLVDELIYSIRNQEIGGVYVTTAWATNKPKQVPITDKQSRYQFSADYLFLASRYN